MYTLSHFLNVDSCSGLLTPGLVPLVSHDVVCLRVVQFETRLDTEGFEALLAFVRCFASRMRPSSNSHRCQYLLFCGITHYTPFGHPPLLRSVLWNKLLEELALRKSQCVCYSLRGRASLCRWYSSNGSQELHGDYTAKYFLFLGRLLHRWTLLLVQNV